MDGRTDGRTDGWIDGSMNRWIDGWMFFVEEVVVVIIALALVVFVVVVVVLVVQCEHFAVNVRLLGCAAAAIVRLYHRFFSISIDITVHFCEAGVKSLSVVVGISNFWLLRSKFGSASCGSVAVQRSVDCQCRFLQFHVWKFGSATFGCLALPSLAVPRAEIRQCQVYSGEWINMYHLFRQKHNCYWQC